MKKRSLILKLIIGAVAFVMLQSCSSSKQSQNDKIFNITVDGEGYHPSEIKTSQDEVILVFTRITEDTCAREVINEEQNINRELPLNEPVKIKFDMKNSQEVTFGCHMNKMFQAVIVKR